MNVLSLFDGMSCGQIALNKLGIKYDKYFACEIDKYAMQVTQHNFPDTIQLGDVQFVTKETFGTHKIDLIMGGSPCQGFSFAGKQLNFDDPRSALFFEFVRLVNELNPKYFLLENVVMKQEYQDVISKYMGCEPVKINSALVSAQTRKRFYWTNIPNVGQPKDKGIVLKDIIESGMTMVDKSQTIKSQYAKSSVANFERKGTFHATGVRVEQVDDKLRHPEATKKGYAEAGEGEGLDLTFPDSKTRRGRAMKDKSNCLTAASQEMGVVIDPSKPNQINPDKSAKSSSEDEKGTQPHMQDRVFHEDGKSHSLTASFASRTKVGKFEVKSYREVRTEDAKKARKEHREKTGDDYTPFRAKELVEREDGKTGTITPSHHKGLNVSVQEDGKKLSWRKLTPLECERLQTVPDGYTLVMEDGKQKVSNSQRYKMLGNGWTVDVITHILKNMQ